MEWIWDGNDKVLGISFYNYIYVSTRRFWSIWTQLHTCRTIIIRILLQMLHLRNERTCFIRSLLD